MAPTTPAAAMIPFLDLKAQHRSIKPEIDSAIQGVFDRGQFILGPEGKALEQEIAAYCQVRYAVGVASGADALELSLRACGVSPGDEVITTAFTFFATAEAIVNIGAAPVFVDIDPVTYNIDPAAVKRALSPRTKAILPVHLFGHPCDMGALMKIADDHKLAVVEDCAQAIGSRYHDKSVGSFGSAGCFSFYPTKNLGAYGDGGMVVTNDEAVAKEVRLLRHHGDQGRYDHVRLGRNSRLDELQAAVLRVKLRHLPRWTDARRERAKHYAEAFARHALPGLFIPQEMADCRHVYHLYTIRAAERQRLKEALEAAGIRSDIHYPSTVPSQPSLAEIAVKSKPCPKAEAAAREVLSLPLYPELELPVIDRVVAAVVKFLS